jgi:hypothetical protein
MSFSTVLLTKSDFPDFIHQKTATVKKIYYHRELKGVLAKGKTGAQLSICYIRDAESSFTAAVGQGSKCALPVAVESINYFKKEGLKAISLLE